MEFTWNPQAIQISSSSDKSYLALHIPFFKSHETFTMFTARSLPDRMTAITALFKTWVPVNCSSDLAEVGCKQLWL